MSLDFNKLREELSKHPGMMLDELAEKIGSVFGIKTEIIKRLLQEEASESLSGLKKELAKDTQSSGNMSDEELNALLTVIAGGKELIKGLSKKEIEELKVEITKFTPTSGLIEKYLPQNLVLRAKNPNHIGDHIAGACLGIVNSAQKVVELLFLIGLGVVQMPQHIYLIATGKGKYDGWDRR